MSYFLYLKKQKAEELLAMCDAFLQIGSAKHTDNVYYVDCMSSLAAVRDELSSSIAYHEQKGLAMESNAMDDRFDELFKNWRKLVETHAEISSLSTSAPCAKVSEILARIDRDLHKKSKPVQIALFDSYISETEQAGRSLHTDTGFEEMFSELKGVHAELKTVENSRAEATAEAVEAPYKVAARAQSVITLIHEHLEGYLSLGNSAYGETLEDLHAQIAPIVTAVKARITKEKNDSEDTPTEEQGNS